jgi:hypothetical protein
MGYTEQLGLQFLQKDKGIAQKQGQSAAGVVGNL